MDISRLSAYADTLIRGRRAIRAFRSNPVPEETLRSVFALAGSAPSSSNTQPWEVEVVSGEARNRLSQDLLAAHAQKRRSPDFLLSNDLDTGIYQDRRRASGAAMYQAEEFREGKVTAEEEAVYYPASKFQTEPFTEQGLTLLRKELDWLIEHGIAKSRFELDKALATYKS